MILLHFHNDDANPPQLSEYVVLVSETVQATSEKYNDEYGSPGFGLDAYDLSFADEWPVTLPLDRGLKAMGI